MQDLEMQNVKEESDGLSDADFLSRGCAAWRWMWRSKRTLSFSRDAMDRRFIRDINALDSEQQRC